MVLLGPFIGTYRGAWYLSKVLAIVTRFFLRIGTHEPPSRVSVTVFGAETLMVT